jgi:hypothetical protein
MGEISNLTPVPLSGFLNLSAVSWQIRVPRPYFMPQPFLGFSLQSFPLTGIVYPSRGRSAPLRLSTDVLEGTTRVLIGRDFTRRPRLATQLPGSLTTYRSPFHEPKPASRSPWATRCGTLPFRQLHPFRSLLLLRVRSRQSELPQTSGRYSPGRSAPPETNSPSLGTSTRPDPKAQTLTSARRPWLATPWTPLSPKEGLCPQHRVRPAQRYE